MLLKTVSSLWFSLPGQWNCESPSATVVCVHRQILVQEVKSKFIVVVVSPLEVLMLDVAEAFTTMDGYQLYLFW